MAQATGFDPVYGSSSLSTAAKNMMSPYANRPGKQTFNLLERVRPPSATPKPASARAPKGQVPVCKTEDTGSIPVGRSRNMPFANKDQGSDRPAVNRFLYGKAFNSTRTAPKSMRDEGVVTRRGSYPLNIGSSPVPATKHIGRWPTGKAPGC